MTLWVMNLVDDASILLGFDWLHNHNPMVNWKGATCTFNRCPFTCTSKHKLEDTDRLFCLNTHAYLKESAQDHGLNRGAVVSKPQVRSEYPERYFHQYPDVFSEDGFDRLPPHRVWDHCIELDKDFIPTNCKIYSLSPDEQKALDCFIEENLRTGRIRHSHSPMASPFFFILKGDGSL